MCPYFTLESEPPVQELEYEHGVMHFALCLTKDLIAASSKVYRMEILQLLNRYIEWR